jgi:hypothetical protein
MRLAWVTLLLASMCGCGSGIFQEYEYEEDLYLYVDGSATLYVNSSLAALNDLRGTSFDTTPGLPLPAEQLRAYFDTSFTRVTRITDSERNDRRYAHVRMDVENVNRLGEAKPFDWSGYRFRPEGELLVYEQMVGASSEDRKSGARWNGDEIVAFRIHVPSRIEYHNAGPGNLRRGNILVWEQALGSRFDGAPVQIEIRMEPRSILNRTLWLFGISAAIVATGFALLLMWLLRAPRPSPDASG